MPAIRAIMVGGSLLIGIIAAATAQRAGNDLAMWTASPLLIRAAVGGAKAAPGVDASTSATTPTPR